ncbi:SpoIIAA-like protein [Palleronia aestuarii]|uniref:SpoIIAA-like protein n=1 Tax=Palleronia aestuarii TaxID=568105 RepID=A0A2W7Q1N7_9RHOB|nr:STAS/SEC14 domain-containing protein [Palleronia aestuarii]PZX15739.1 SpoIIAA-like protein [Palleronia aestuarii]
MMNSETIQQIPTDNPDLYAFRVTGEVTGADMEAMAEYMNAAFDTHEKVSMLLLFENYHGSETGAGLDWDSVKSRFRSLSKVDKYAVVGAPDGAARMIDMMDKVIPVDARTFTAGEADAAWRFVGARPA